MNLFFKKRKSALTLIEVMVACAVLGLFLVIVYRLFIAGGRTASRAQWISNSTDQTRNALNFLNRELAASTYPVTVFSDTFFDPADNPDWSVPAQFYVRILKDDEPIVVPSSGEKQLMSWVVSEPEMPGSNPGKIAENELWLVFRHDTPDGPVGDLVYRRSVYEFTTSADQYARSGNLNKSALSDESQNRTLVNDVSEILITIGGVLPSQRPLNPVERHPVSIQITTMNPRDTRVTRENRMMMAPQVAIDTF